MERRRSNDIYVKLERRRNMEQEVMMAIRFQVEPRLKELRKWTAETLRCTEAEATEVLYHMLERI